MPPGFFSGHSKVVAPENSVKKEFLKIPQKLREKHLFQNFSAHLF